jgi:hypothetical protein
MTSTTRSPTASRRVEAVVFDLGDDNAANVDAAVEMGMIGIRFVGPQALRRDLAALGLPVRPG